MARFERETWVAAPLDDVWAFHSTVDGLRALTPSWLDLRVEEIRRPGDDARDSHVLEAGTELHASVAPLGLGPRQHWVSVIEARDESPGTCYFVDRMREGPLPHWQHTHLFYGDGDRTLVRDSVAFRTPVGDSLDRVVAGGLAPFFAYRHRRTREILGT